MDLSKYKKPALNFSGGKDSLACLYLFKDQLDRVTVYHTDTGDHCPEMQEVVESVKEWVPNFVTIKTDVKSWRGVNGIPSDLVPASAHWIGVAAGMNDFLISNRMDCCFQNIMLPMHNRMIEDGVDAVIRGTKLVDTGKVPAEGDTGHYDLLLPLKDWSHQDVFDYLEKVGAPRNRIYEHFGSISAPECFGCTAWWDDNKAKYFKALHPEQYGVYVQNLLAIGNTISLHLEEMNRELVGE